MKPIFLDDLKTPETLERFLDNIHWDEAAKFYQENGWNWGFGSATHYPTAQELREGAKELVVELGEIPTNISTGRMMVSTFQYRPKKPNPDSGRLCVILSVGIFHDICSFD